MTLREWLDLRVPPVPGPFAVWMEPTRPEAEADVESLAAEAETALARSLRPEGRPRKGAFDLLRADGYLTYACEAALEAGDARVRLAELMRRFGA